MIQLHGTPRTYVLAFGVGGERGHPRRWLFTLEVQAGSYEAATHAARRLASVFFLNEEGTYTVQDKEGP